MANTAHAHLLELGVLQRHQRIARDALVDKGVAVLLEPNVRHKVGHLLGAPVDNQPRRADAAVSAVREGGRRVLGAQRAGAGGRALVLDGDLVALLPRGALELVVGVRVLVVLGHVVAVVVVVAAVGHGAHCCCCCYCSAQPSSARTHRGGAGELPGVLGRAADAGSWPWDSASTAAALSETKRDWPDGCRPRRAELGREGRGVRAGRGEGPGGAVDGEAVRCGALRCAAVLATPE